MHEYPSKAFARNKKPGKNGLYQCVCCHKYTLPDFERYDICHECGWEDDGDKSDPDCSYGANHISINEAHALYKNGFMIAPNGDIVPRTAANKALYSDE